MLPITAAHEDEHDQALHYTDTDPDVLELFVYKGFYGRVLFLYPMQNGEDDTDEHDVPGEIMGLCANDDFQDELKCGADEYQPAP